MRFDPEKNDIRFGPEVIIFPTIRFYTRKNKFYPIDYME